MNDKALYGNRLWEYLIVSPSFRWLRHFILLSLLFIIVFSGFIEDLHVLLRINFIIIACVILVFVMWGIVCINIYYLIPVLLFKGKYGRYLFFISICVFFVTFLLYIAEYYMENNYAIENKVLTGTWGIFLFIVVNIFLSGFYIFAFSFTIFLQRWVYHNMQINKLQKDKLQANLNQLKDQIQPDFLSRMLNKANLLVKDNEEEASRLLMRLSYLLRYQLYDSAREKVLLTADISFIKDYLNLEQIFNQKLDYSICTNGDINHILIPPLLFIPVIERAQKYIADEDFKGNPVISMRFDINDALLGFICAHPRTEKQIQESALANLKKRLELLFGKNFFLKTYSEEGNYYTHLQITVE